MNTSKQNRTLSADDIKLVLALAKTFHKAWVSSSFNEIQGYSHHGFRNIYKSLLEVLWVLNLGKAAWPKDDLFGITYAEYQRQYANSESLGFAPYFKPISKSEIDKAIDFKNFYPSLSVFGILTTFIDLVVDAGTLPTKRNSNFTALDANLKESLHTLVELGYAKVTAIGYKWTDKIAPTMICLSDWKEKDFDYTKTEPTVIKRQVSRIRDHGLNRMPSWFWDGYGMQDSKTVMGLTFGILQCWSGSDWTDEPVETQPISFDNAIAMSHEILGFCTVPENY